MVRFEDYTPNTDDIRAAWLARAADHYMSESVAAQAFEDWLDDTIKASHVSNDDLYDTLDDMVSDAMSASNAAEDVYYSLKKMRDSLER